MSTAKSNVLTGRDRFVLSGWRKEEQDHADAQPLKVTCGLCGKVYEGKAGKTRQLALAHREKKHPETLLRKTRRTRRALGSFRYVHLDADEIKEIQNERRKRALLNGIELDA